jgi:hypothetical protein
MPTSLEPTLARQGGLGHPVYDIAVIGKDSRRPGVSVRGRLSPRCLSFGGVQLIYNSLKLAWPRIGINAEQRRAAV